MKNLACRFNWPVLVVLCVAAAILLPGCEEGPDTSAATSYFAQNPYTTMREDMATITLMVDPAEKSLSYDGQTFVLTAAGGTPPYTWSVHDVGVGTILRSKGYYAVYQRNAPGDNVVVLRDKSKTEVYCTIMQPEEETTE